MSETFRCDDKDMLVAFLYGEIESDGRREVERHLRTCAACTREVDALQQARQDLQAWVPPDVGLGFTIVQTERGQGTPPVLTSRRWAALRDLPAWAQVAAAVLLLGVAAALANVQVRSTSDGVVVSTGWLPVETAAAIAPPAASDQDWRRELAALEQNLRSEMAARETRIETLSTPPRASAADVDAAAVLRDVQSIVDAAVAASEQRQRDELALRLTMAERSWNQRQAANWNAIVQRMSTLQGRTFAVEAGQQEMFNRLRRVALTPNQ